MPDANIQFKLMPLDPALAKQRIAADIAAGVARANVPDSTIDRHAALYGQMLEDIKHEGMTAFTEAPKTEAPATSVRDMPMNYRDGTNGLAMRPEYKGKSTMDLIREVARTATTGARSRFAGLNVGDVFTVVGGTASASRCGSRSCRSASTA